MSQRLSSQTTAQESRSRYSCPVKSPKVCSSTFGRLPDLKRHIAATHLHCAWHICPFCGQQLWQVTDKHPNKCERRHGADVPRRLESGCDARSPLLVRWTPSMELPTLARDGSARMVVAQGHVMLCARGSDQVTNDLSPSTPAPLVSALSVERRRTQDAAPTLTIESPVESPRWNVATHRPSHSRLSPSVSGDKSTGTLANPFEYDSPSPSASSSMPSPASNCFTASLFASPDNGNQTMYSTDDPTRLSGSTQLPPDFQALNQRMSEYNRFAPAADSAPSKLHQHFPSTERTAQFYPAPDSLSVRSAALPGPTGGTDKVYTTDHRPPVSTPARRYSLGGQYLQGPATQVKSVPQPTHGVFQSSEQAVASWGVIEMLRLTQSEMPIHVPSQAQVQLSSVPPQYVQAPSASGRPNREWSSLDVSGHGGWTSVPTRGPRPTALNPTNQPPATMISAHARHAHAPVPAALGSASGSSLLFHSTGQPGWTSPPIATQPNNGHPSRLPPAALGYSYGNEIFSDGDWDTRLSFDPAFSNGYGP